MALYAGRKEETNMESSTLPLPLAALLAVRVRPETDANGVVMGGTADDEDSSRNTTYTDDIV